MQHVPPTGAQHVQQQVTARLEGTQGMQQSSAAAQQPNEPHLSSQTASQAPALQATRSSLRGGPTSHSDKQKYVKGKRKRQWHRGTLPEVPIASLMLSLECEAVMRAAADSVARLCSNRTETGGKRGRVGGEVVHACTN